MSYYDLLPFLETPDRKYYLQKLITYEKEHKVIKDEIGNIIRKDEVGNIAKEWQDIQELHGTIQHRQDDKTDTQGKESDVTYHGIFTPEFTLEMNQLANYRIKYVRNYETNYLYIKEYDPNNYLFDKQHHITLILQEDKKYHGEQE